MILLTTWCKKQLAWDFSQRNPIIHLTGFFYALCISFFAPACQGLFYAPMKISPHFSRSEFACQCGCGFETVDIDLIEMLEIIRGRYDEPITVTSGCRCPEHNRSIGGSENSWHMQGRAADFKVHNVDPERVASFIRRHSPDRYGVGVYDTWIHLDSRDTKADWDFRS